MRSIFILLTFSTLLLTACQSSKTSIDGYPDYSGNEEMRHGWAIFTGPKPTKMSRIDEESIKNGEKLFQKYCIRCHRSGGKGPDPKTIGFDSTESKKFSEKAIKYYLVFQMNEGKGEMPQWKDILSQRDMWDLSNYLQSIQSK